MLPSLSDPKADKAAQMFALAFVENLPASKARYVLQCIRRRGYVCMSSCKATRNVLSLSPFSPANSPDGKAQNLDMVAIIDKAFGQPDMPSEYVRLRCNIALRGGCSPRSGCELCFQKDLVYSRLFWSPLSNI